MSEGHYSWGITETIRGGGSLSLGFHALIVMIGTYVVLSASAACFRGTPLPAGRYVFLSFLPLVFASLGIYCCLIAIRTVYFAEGLVDPGALPAHIANARLFLYSGWLWTTLSLLLVYIASRRKMVDLALPPIPAP